MGDRKVLNVMLVDDESIVRSDIRELTEWESYDYKIAAEAESGPEALRLLEKHSIDIMIVDIQMPGMTGLELAERILAEGKQIKFIFLTSYDDFEFARSSMRMGVRSYILKHEADGPVLLHELERLRDELQKSQQQTRLGENEYVKDSLNEYEDVEEDYKERIDKVKNYVDKHYMEDLSLDTLAGLIGVSEAYMSQLFKQQTGVTFKHYLRDFRMEKAKELLLSGKEKVHNIGAKVGYSTAPYFCLVFKQYYGVTPTEFFRRNSGKNEEE